MKKILKTSTFIRFVTSSSASLSIPRTRTSLYNDEQRMEKAYISLDLSQSPSSVYFCLILKILPDTRNSVISVANLKPYVIGWKSSWNRNQQMIYILTT